MTQLNVTYYPFKVWFATMIVAPFLHSIFIQFYHRLNGIGDFIPAYFGMVIFGFLLSIPSFLLYYFLIIFLEKTPITSLLIKSAGAISSIAFMFLTNNLLVEMMGGDITHPKSISFLTVYSGCIVLFSLRFNLNRTESQ